MDEERITLEVTITQAQALVDAANCVADVFEGNVEALVEIWLPKSGPDQGAANQMGLDVARHAQDVAAILRVGIDGARKRNPELQDLLHRAKMFRKYHGDEL